MIYMIHDLYELPENFLFCFKKTVYGRNQYAMYKLQGPIIIRINISVDHCVNCAPYDQGSVI